MKGWAIYFAVFSLLAAAFFWWNWTRDAPDGDRLATYIAAADGLSPLNRWQLHASKNIRAVAVPLGVSVTMGAIKARAASAVAMVDAGARAPSAWPDATNTGYLPTGQQLGAQQGPLKISTPGTYTGLWVVGRLHITVSNVTVQNSLVQSGDFFGIEIDAGLTGILVQDTEIDCLGLAGAQGSSCIMVSGGGLTVLRCNIHSGSNGMSIGYGPVTFKDNYIHDLLASGGTLNHYNGIQYNGGGAGDGPLILIQHNTISNPNGWVDATMIDNVDGPATNVTIDNNQLLGPNLSYTSFFAGSFTSSAIIATFTNNHVQLGRGRGDYVFTRRGSASPFTITHSGNVDVFTGASIDWRFR